jgi:hypothetical protein
MVGYDYCLPIQICDIDHSNINARVPSMQDSQFDPFGEPVVGKAIAQQRPVSLWVMRAGTSLFWLLVAAIVVARVAFFDPELANRFDHAAAFARALYAMIAA